MPQAIKYANITVPLRGQDAAGSSEGKFVPICFSRLPDEALTGLPLYMRNQDTYTLYAAAGVKFTPAHRQRLEELGISFVHIPADEEPRLRRQLEERIEELAGDVSIEPAVRCEIIYEHAIELLNETQDLCDPDNAMPRLRQLAQAVVRMYQGCENAFEHFFAASRHDDCVATHAANVSIWFPALAMALGEKSDVALATLSLGGMLYDLGMVYVPSDLLKQERKLIADEMRQIQPHADTGAQILRQLPELDPVIEMMAQQHHERSDGSGYPKKLVFEQIHPAARMAAVLDTFEAVTSFRPFRKPGYSPADAFRTLLSETPHHYDARMVEAWMGVFRKWFPSLLPEKTEAESDEAGMKRRRFERYVTNFPAVIETLSLESGKWTQHGVIRAVAHNISRGGVGFIMQTPLQVGRYFRAKLSVKDGVVRQIAGIVVRVRQRQDGFFEAGSRFVDLDQVAAQPRVEEIKNPPADSAPSSPGAQIQGKKIKN